MASCWHPYFIWLGLDSFTSQVQYELDHNGESDSDEECWLDWRDQEIQMRDQLEMPSDLMPWVGYKLDGVPSTRRYHVTLQIGYYAYLCAGHPPMEWPNWYCDISQAIKRKPWSQRIPCFGRRSLLYSYKFDRVLCGEDLLTYHISFILGSLDSVGWPLWPLGIPTRVWLTGFGLTGSW